MTPISSSSDGISDAALATATGRTWADWYAVLDEQGAAGAADPHPSRAWTHPQIARWLGDVHSVDAWWCQAITVGFEQARGLRLPGQRADGSFEVSASKTLPLEQQGALDAVVSAVSADLGVPASRSTSATYATARWSMPGGSSVLATASPSKNGRTSVSLTRQRLSSADQVGLAKTQLTAWLTAAV
ncbi:MAG: hypothetical protein R6W83_03615 [Cryobacterium sp.]